MPWLVGYPREKIRWHPIIDYDKCSACGVCLSCGNKVFRWKDGRPEVAEPLRCVIGCTTCANLCPEWAISFPEIAEVRRIYREEGIWEKITKAIKEERSMKMASAYRPPEWAIEFHGHRCPFMPIGYRMGRLAMEYLGVEREKDHGFFVFPELGEGHPQTCMMDGIQIATGATYGKVLMAKTFYGKLAATFYHPKKGAVRYALKPDFMDAMGKFEFFAYRRRGVEPSEIPPAVVEEVIRWVDEQPDEALFKIEPRPEFKFTPPKGSFNKTKCSVCGEYVFERYVRLKDGRPVCIPCSEYGTKKEV